MQRLGDYGRCWRAVDPGPYDLILPDVGEYTVIVAMGTEQLLVRNRQGHWEQKSPFEYSPYSPLPFYASNLGEAFRVVAREVDFVVLFVLFVLWLLSFRCAQLLKSVLPQKKLSAFRRAVPLFIVFLLASVAVGIWYASGFVALGSLILYAIQTLRDWHVTGVFIFIPVIGVAFPLIAFIATWSPIARSAAFPNRVWLIAGCTALVALLIASSIIGIFILWAFGVIAEYALAALFALIVSIAIIVYGYRSVEVWARKCV
jgi:hypothetical protein